MERTFLDYFRCPEQFAEVGIDGELSAEEGFFRFGKEITCYGQCAGAQPSREMRDQLPDVTSSAGWKRGQVSLPFSITQVVDNLRNERYALNSSFPSNGITGSQPSRFIYYFLRPVLPVSVRRYLQRAHLRGWQGILFPHWPVDFTVELLMERIMALILKSRSLDRIPFVWFWPNGAPAAAMVTHDVEGEAGRNFSNELMNLDDGFDIKSSFQIVPESRYQVTKHFLESIRARGFETNVHDLSHDGSLFRDRQEFCRRAALINKYANDFQARGFRAGAMYRNQEWYDAFNFSYDMSVPNAAHLEPQRGGCCTVMPYFIGKILELPLTMTQDYSLFHILDDYSIDLWKQEVELLMQGHGLISFITHPDYVVEKRARAVYLDLLSYLAGLRASQKLWIALPSEINDWWRSRRQMQLVQDRGHWQIEGPEKERARIAHATLKEGRVAYDLEGDPELKLAE